jgi:lysozyme
MDIPTNVLEIWRPLVRHFEGCRLEAYQDSIGVWTIGDGHTGPDVHEGLVWTQDMADSTFAVDLSQHYTQTVQAVPAIVSESPGRQAAIADFVYNLGIGTFHKSTLHSAVLVGAWESVKHQLSLWDHAGGKILPGLVARRAAEIALI